MLRDDEEEGGEEVSLGEGKTSKARHGTARLPRPVMRWRVRGKSMRCVSLCACIREWGKGEIWASKNRNGNRSPPRLFICFSKSKSAVLLMIKHRTKLFSSFSCYSIRKLI